MSTFRVAYKILGAAAVLSAAIATRAAAQPVIYEPAYCAQYYPNANCQNMGPGNPNDINFRRGLAANGPTQSVDEALGVAKKRLRPHRSASAAHRVP
jgi:hypothetical protein